jgi:hypothetical protein
MTPGTAAIAARLMAHPRWRWAPGMRTATTRRVCWVTEGVHTHDVPGGIYDHDMRVRPDNGCDPLVDLLPDLDDPATCGVLLVALAAERICFAEYGARGWAVVLDHPEHGPSYLGTLGIALATALLEAWGQP